TQLFGERMIIANATGCSSIWGGTFPTMPYTTFKNGKGPAWANSLFEDNAEYGLGFRLAVDANRRQLKSQLERLLEADIHGELKECVATCLKLWTEIGDEAQANAGTLRRELVNAAKIAAGGLAEILAKAIELQDYAVDKSVWIIGGDGWAYDIGYGGLDHVLAQNRNVNVMVLDTEVYSNTGGQASKATPFGSIAKFASAGKHTGKKDLGLMAMSYGTSYVASIALGANPVQAVKAMSEAESYNGPSIIIAYAPCIAHGIDMSTTPDIEKNAVESGYWVLYRYDPRRSTAGQNPLLFDSKEPTMSVLKFIAAEKRYSQLKSVNPKEYEKLYGLLENDVTRKYNYLKKLSEIEQADICQSFICME
ncbi:pyruvate:ferredoxin (flavodoxin) oxidoreductase, partial [bacterium]|nr:pyruvate:ferredoxin (flavodoxin) oxidoreductase [candidate division CSSED10-310 bacterium]